MAPETRRRRWSDVDKTDIPVSELLQQFLMYQEDSNHSTKTVRWYSDMLGRFVTSLPAEACLLDIDAASIRVYLHNNRQNGASKFTLHAYARTLKTFFRWLHREGYVEEELHRHIHRAARTAVRIPKQDSWKRHPGHGEVDPGGH